MVTKDRLVALGDESQGIALVKADEFLNLANSVKKAMSGRKK